MCTFALSPRGRLVDIFHGKARAFGSGFFLFELAILKMASCKDGERQYLASLFSLLSGNKKLKFGFSGALLFGGVSIANLGSLRILGTFRPWSEL